MDPFIHPSLRDANPAALCCRLSQTSQAIRPVTCNPPSSLPKNAGRLLDFPGTEKNTGKMPCSASEELMPDRNLMETADAF
jgi:hypothetical protein